jgi:hypothetical protein
LLPSASNPRCRIDGLKLFFFIGLCSFSTLAYEIVLTRIFSISLWYHFAFMVVSIAMLGLGASGTILTLFPRLRHPAHLGSYGLVLGATLSASTLVANQIPFDPVALSWSGFQIIYIGLYYVVLAVPFFMTGLIIATALSSLSQQSGLVYGADLLGAGTGSLGILGLMTLVSPERLVFILSMVALIACVVLSRRILRILSLVLILLNFGMLIFLPEFVQLRMSPYKGLQVALRYPGAERLGTYDSPFSRIDFFRSPAVRFAPGLSLTYFEPLPEQIGFSIDGGEINAITSPRDAASMGFLSYLPTALPYEVGKREDVLILDPQGGLQVLVAEHYGARSIDKVESTPFLMETIAKEWSAFSGEIYSKQTWSGLGRSWLRSRQRQYDLIEISFLRPIPSGSFSISEDYRFTVEAFKTYLQSLKPDGVLSINLFILPPPRTEWRLLATLATAMEGLGLGEAERRIAAIRSWGSLCIIAKRSPWNPDEVEAIRKFSRERKFDLVHCPGVKEEEKNIHVRMVSNEYFVGFKNLLNPDTRGGFIKSYLFDIEPVYDQNPFFNYYLKLGNLRQIYHRMGEKWQFFVEEGYLLPAVLVQVLLLSSLLILLPALLRKKEVVGGSSTCSLGFARQLMVLSLFACLGIGFMFVEVALIQKMILPLEHPSYAVATVLTSLLLGSGTGSLLSHWVHYLRSRWVVAAIAGLIVLTNILLPIFSEMISMYSLPLRIFFVCFMLFVFGLPMGIPFPLALKTLGESYGGLIPWAWAVNGCFSVLAPLLAIMLAMALGFQVVLWAGAGAYLLGFAIFSFPPLRSEERR